MQIFADDCPKNGKQEGAYCGKCGNIWGFYVANISDAKSDDEFLKIVVI